MAQLSTLSTEPASNRDLIHFKWGIKCISFERSDTASVFQRADFSHPPVLRTKHPESSPKPQVNQGNVFDIGYSVCQKGKWQACSWEALQEERGRASPTKAAFLCGDLSSGQGGSWAGPSLHHEYSSSGMKSRTRVTFPKADCRIWTHQHFTQLSICQHCNSLSLAKKEIFSWEKFHP